MDFIKSYKKTFKNFSRIISHLGFGLLIFFIGINHNFSIEEDFNLKVGDEKRFNNYSVNFSSLKLEEKENYKSVVGLFKISDLEKISTEQLKPEIRIYSQPKTMTYETSIKTKITHDLYLTMSNIDQSEFYNIKFQKKPFMVWIWISAFIISIGGFTRFLKRS
jgi:cytochrome c-type biogenesis protein CcmF